jgi:hypothetical protein
MSDPLRPPNKPAPRRAEPLQPDNPGRGDAAEKPPAPATGLGDESLDRAMEQEKTALDNVRSTG